MSAAATPARSFTTVAHLLKRLGSIPPDRVRFQPTPGTATESDLLTRPNGVKRLCELVDGVLVEKAMGFYESRMAATLIEILGEFLRRHDLGIVLGADALLRLEPGLVRIPDVSFFAWSRFPRRKLPREPIPDLAPDLAVEVLSASNTPAEMRRKLREYFASGARLVWYVDPEEVTVEVYTSSARKTVIDETGTLDGGRVLPGFRLPVRRWFERAGERTDS